MAVNARSGQICTHPYPSVQNASSLAFIEMCRLRDRDLPFRIATHTVTSIMQVDANGEDIQGLNMYPADRISNDNVDATALYR